ncbi:MAG: hypothetical protein COT06_02725 [Syntrophobacteraceae bacterium CG07_land_8_20_14_0_80_61_8]|nr:MAG: hypothetical protein COT06_02725 [Syntrophobacteraceae bacterium CG07_land_8_20_14_0_80_61_8]
MDRCIPDVRVRTGRVAHGRWYGGLDAVANAITPKANASEAIPASWENRARKAWEYYLEEPLMKNCVNSWRTFTVGEAIKIAGDDEKVKHMASGGIALPVGKMPDKRHQRTLANVSLAAHQTNLESALDAGADHASEALNCSDASDKKL